jgi:NADH-quinone oxidoreductase subunit N
VPHSIAILPASIVALAGVAILLLGRVSRIPRLCAGLSWLALLAAAASLALARPEPPPEPPARVSVKAVTLDSLSAGTAWMALVLGAACVALTSLGSNQRVGNRLGVVMLSLAGVLLACVANDFLLVILAVPVSMLSIGAGQFFEAETAEERFAAIQMLVMDVLGAVCLVAGALLVSWLAGTTNLTELQALPAHTGAATDQLATRGARTLPLAGEVGAVLLLAGFGIPLLAAPFQLAAAEIFEGSTSWSVALTAVLPRCAVLVAMIRVFVESMPRYLSTTQTALTAISLVTLLIGGSLAYWQTSLRRLIALVMMVQAGVILLALAASCSEAARPDAVRWISLQIPGGAGAAWLLFAVDSLAVLGLMVILSGLERAEGRVDELAEVPRLLRNDRTTATAMAFLLFTLAGVPPLPGFWTRVAVLRSILSVSFPPENDFLPHQNTGYVLFALLTVGALIAVAAPCVIAAVRLLITDGVLEAAETQPPPGDRPRSRSRFAIAIAAVVVVLGFVPSEGLRLAARVTFHRPSGAVLAAQKAEQPVKKHRRARMGDSE